ncbi:sodium-dependent phosphate transport protein 2A [Eurytemora carolleeae]|uniref:sodium-dependent phosphate transport protein 2A n=1 Tax=Eurytemora carolleeae TaxID=1294199 RepID=UPI000C76507A|nr:sodium-dependent phosphate transport protein 2A [Eurytemora carolleeae]|eukprot:XP_023335519.1 sodium-dependent phosphate transport protein 2A-like [Eurytemora affinis]
MVDHIASSKGNSSSLGGETSSPDFLKKVTGPFTKSIIQLDKHVLEAWAANDPEYANVTTILKLNCKGENETMLERCPYLFAFLGPQGSDIGDKYMGILLLALALGMLSGCLLGMVKSLNSLLGTRVKGFIERTINTDIPIRGLGWLTGYMYMFVGAVITVLVQSSSVFTSTLTPLAGAGLISLERAYPLTLGSNIGTTTTSLIASIAAGGENVADAIQIALVHLMFNLIGIILFYPIPVLRWPISLARTLGDNTAQYRWISLVYLIGMFFLFPIIIFAISLAGPLAMYIILLPIAIIIILAIIINLVQNHKPSILPGFLKNWDFLPLFLHSLEPYDKIITRLCGWCRCCKPSTVSPTSNTGENEEENTEEGKKGEEKEGGKEKEGKMEKEASTSLKKMTKDNEGFENYEVV